MSNRHAISRSRTCRSAYSPPMPILARIGVAIGDQILDLAVLEESGLLSADPAGNRVFNRSSLNGSWRGRAVWRETRGAYQRTAAPRESPASRRSGPARPHPCPAWRRRKLHLPVEIGGYTDFYSSKEHATNVGMMFRDPKNALLPNWLLFARRIQRPRQFGGGQRHAAPPAQRADQSARRRASQLRSIRQAGHRAGNRLHRG